MSKLTLNLVTMPETSIMVGSEGAIHVLESGKVIRILTAAQARDLSGNLELAARHSDGGLVGEGV